MLYLCTAFHKKRHKITKINSLKQKKIMKKIIIRQAGDKFICYVDQVTPRFTEKLEDVIATFDVSECFIHC